MTVSECSRMIIIISLLSTVHVRLQKHIILDMVDSKVKHRDQANDAGGTLCLSLPRAEGAGSADNRGEDYKVCAGTSGQQKIYRLTYRNNFTWTLRTFLNLNFSWTLLNFSWTLRTFLNLNILSWSWNIAGIFMHIITGSPRRPRSPPETHNNQWWATN